MVVTIPLSILSALIALRLVGQTINIMTLSGLALAVGILVDEATVAIENIHTHLAMGKKAGRAVVDAMHEVMQPRFLAMICILAVFIPTFFLVGISRALFPPLADAAGRSRLGVAEDVRVAPYELPVDAACDLLEAGSAALLEQQRQKVDLEEQVTQLVGELRIVVGDRRVGHLECFLDRVRHDRACRLLAVPRTVAPQPLRQSLKVLERAPEVVHVVVVGVPATPRQGSGEGL